MGRTAHWGDGEEKCVCVRVELGRATLVGVSFLSMCSCALERSTPWHALCTVIAVVERHATSERERMVSMVNYTSRRLVVGLAAGLVAYGVLGVAPARAQSVPIIVPPISPIVIGITPAIPSLIVGIPGDSGVHSRSGVTWSTTGRADVDIDIDRHHGQAAAR